jgi:hypothetical protein
MFGNLNKIQVGLIKKPFQPAWLSHNIYFSALSARPNLKTNSQFGLEAQKVGNLLLDQDIKSVKLIAPHFIVFTVKEWKI